MWALLIAMPLPASVRRGAMAPTIVTSRPSRIQTVPSPITIRQWNLDHGRRSMRLGICVVIVRPRRSAGGRAALDVAVTVLIAAAPGGRVVWDAPVPPARPSLPLQRRRRDDALAMRARLRRGRREALSDCAGGGALRAGLRARARRRRAAHASRRAATAAAAVGPRQRRRRLTPSPRRPR